MAIALVALVETGLPQFAERLCQIQERVLIDQRGGVRLRSSCGLVKLRCLSYIQFEVPSYRLSVALSRDSVRGGYRRLCDLSRAQVTNGRPNNGFRISKCSFVADVGVNVKSDRHSLAWLG